jgi:carboxyl-terminal processing protease
MDQVMDGAMRGLADSLDPDSSYLTPEDVKVLEARTPLPDGEIGVIVSRQYYLRVIGIEDGSPADRAGLQTGDFIRAIGETPTRDMSAFAGARLLRGPVGSTVSLLIIRGNAADPHEITVVREAPRTERAAGQLLETGEAYVRVASFEEGAAAALRTAVTALGSAATAPGVIIDIRDTADGDHTEGIAAARLFVKSGVLATRIRRNATPVIVETAAGDGAFAMPIVLLVSNGTAHAAEVFAAALANNDRATLIGEPTAGIAATQQLFTLPQGHGLWMTTERYVQTDGTPIHGRGLSPDVPLAIPRIGFDEQPSTTDDVLDRAREELAGTGSAPREADEAPAPR